MTARLEIGAAGLDEVRLLAELVALKLAAGDVVALRGEVGAGKTTFARALIRALLADDTAEIPSPTFPLVQTYVSPRFAIAHFDFYRLGGAGDLDEIGYWDAAGASVTIVEWPERAEAALGPDRLEIAIAAGPAPNQRRLVLEGHGRLAPRLARLIEMKAFLAASAPAMTGISYLQGDASARAYARVAQPDAPSLILMDSPRMADGPPVHNGRPYSRIAHLAEDVRPFVALGRALAAAGLSVPHIAAADLAQGLLLLEDLGDLTFGRALAEGHDQHRLTLAAVDMLVGIRKAPLPRDLPLPDGTTYRLPRFDRAALEIEIGLILDWYWPAVNGEPAPGAVRDELLALWSPVLDRMLAAPPGLFLRDVHSPNLFWLPERTGIRRVGVIDFQDALAEPFAYDLASLLQDARVDVAAMLEAEGLARYCAAVAEAEPDFDAEGFRALYAAFGAQRNTRLVGLWVRLLQRDGKPQYLRHMAGTWDYLARNLAHPELGHLRAWYDRHFPEAVRRAPIAV